MYSNAYDYNNPSVDLDKLARKVNEQRRKLANNVAMEFDKDMNEINRGINKLENSKNKIYLPASMTNNIPCAYGEFTNRDFNIPTFFENLDNSPNSFNIPTFSENSDNPPNSFNIPTFSENSDNPPNSFNISEENKNKILNNKYPVFSENLSYGSFSSLPDSLIKNNKYDFSSINEISDGETNFTDNISNMSLSVESKLPIKVKSKLKENKHLHELHSDKDILTHINSCSPCRKELLSLITNAKYCNREEFRNINIIDNKNNKSKKQKQIKTKKNISDIKDIIIILMIGLFIMILLDLFMKKK